MPAAVQTSVLDVLKSAQNSSDGSLNVNATLSATNVTVTNASGGSAVNIQDGGNSITVDGTVAVTGVATAANQATEIASLASIDGKITAVNTGAVVVSSSALPSGASTEATLATLNTKVTACNTGAVTISAALPAGTNAIGSVQPTVSASSAVTSVASSASSVTLLSSNSSRKAAYFFNDSTQVLYIKFGTTASATSYTVQVAAGAFYEMPPIPCYTGQIDGIWASANGNARITELS